MKQILIRNLKLLNPGIYLIRGLIKQSIPEPLITLPFNGSDTHSFIKKYKPHLKAMIKRAGFPDVFVAYWFIDKGKAFVYLCPEHKEVNEWYRYLLDGKNEQNY